MEVNIRKALNLFFPKPSLMMVYAEAFANAVDAGADEIKISITIDALDKPETLSIKIQDNGFGFNNNNFDKFSRLLEANQTDHKGTGRLIFLHYFESVAIESYYTDSKRIFNFSENFTKESSIEKNIDNKIGTSLTFKNYQKEKLGDYDYLRPNYIKDFLINKFLPLFYLLREKQNKLVFSITSYIKENEQKEKLLDYQSPITFSISDLPILQKSEMDKIALFDNSFTVHYSIQQKIFEKSLIVTAICADNRVIEGNIISEKDIPANYEVIVLLIFKAQEVSTDPSRTNFNLKSNEIGLIREIFRNKVSELLNDNIPAIKERNEVTHTTLLDQFPHLGGYFNFKTVGLLTKDEVLKDAQAKFFQDQKKILEATTLTDEDYLKSLAVSARLLTEYILYRNIIINKLKKVDTKNSETEIHNMIVPRYKVYKKSTFIDDMYLNNAWLLDDKYMSYSTILSEMDMERLIENIGISEYSKDDARPDIALVFSREPSEEAKADLVIVELKKLGLNLKRKIDVITQLYERARKLLQYYPNKIQRIWFYGIVDIDTEFELYLKDDGYIPLYSNGKLFCRPDRTISIAKDITTLATFYIMDYEAFVADAESRNDTFLQILKEGLKRK